MADAPITTTKLDGFFKEVYGEDVPDLIPRDMKVQELIKFAPAEKQLGNKFNQPVRLTDSSGFTFAGADAGAFSLNDARALTLKNAEVSGAQVLLREQMDYETAARASKGRNAFKDATKYLLESMQKSHRKINEIQCLYGQSSIGEVDSESSGVITLDVGEFAAALWSGLEGSVIDIYDDLAGTTLKGDGLVITAIDTSARTIAYTGTYTSPAAGDKIFFDGAFGNEMAGIHKILTNTGSLFGISAATYSLWKASSQAAGGALNRAIVGEAVAKAVDKGLNDDIDLLLNTQVWNDLLDDEAALRRYADKSGSEFVNGADKITFHSQNGSISIHAHKFVKQGYAYGLCKDEWKRIGATDVTMKTPGNGDQIFFHLPTKAGFEVRSYSNQAVFCHAPAKNFIITGITT